MTLADTRPTTEAAADATPRGFRPTPRRRARIAAGAVVAAMAIGGNVLLFSSLDDRSEVLQLVTNVRAGEIVTADDLRIVEVDVDPTVPVVAAPDISTVVGQHARTYLVSGSLITPNAVQSDPLVAEGAAVVAIPIDTNLVPAGLATRSQIWLVLEPDTAESTVVPARVVRYGDSNNFTVEVDVDEAPEVARAAKVRIVLIDPGVDAASEVGT